MGIGYGLYSLAHSYLALLAVAIVASLGFHNWIPLRSALGLALAEKRHSGRVLGSLDSIGALATIIGMLGVALFSAPVSLRGFFVIAGLSMVVGGLIVSRLPKNVSDVSEKQPRLLLKRRYWLYYVLILFEGSRMQVFHTFGTLILVQYYGFGTRDVSILLVVSGLVNFLVAPLLGRLLDTLGERLTLSASYVLLALCFVGYATVHHAWFLSAMLIGIRLLVTLRIGLSTYVNRIAPPDELTATLSAGVSINHITSVTMSLLAGSLLGMFGYEALCWGSALIITLSVPFALAIRTDPGSSRRAQTAPER